MKVTVYIHPNDRLDVEVPDDTGQTLVDEHPPLSDYAMSREGIYEGHPKL